MMQIDLAEESQLLPPASGFEYFFWFSSKVGERIILQYIKICNQFI